ncbi:hypothetical protein F8388_003409 [Cannabis sativa]|uniref:Uncharacterized protein n=1 Tax=Cannabis sativa TaxID=3483 RepID=A0A7J6E376_CANSA|nr:hypothetical protein F8388_003409 [Cannabis sativa]
MTTIFSSQLGFQTQFLHHPPATRDAPHSHTTPTQPHETHTSTHHRFWIRRDAPAGHPHRRDAQPPPATSHTRRTPPPSPSLSFSSPSFSFFLSDSIPTGVPFPPLSFIMSQSSNSVNSGRRYKEEIQWSRPICGCGFESVSALQELLIIQTKSSMAAQITRMNWIGDVISLCG